MAVGGDETQPEKENHVFLLGVAKSRDFEKGTLETLFFSPVKERTLAKLERQRVGKINFISGKISKTTREERDIPRAREDDYRGTGDLREGFCWADLP